jgi:hypothetical protein
VHCHQCLFAEIIAFADARRPIYQETWFNRPNRSIFDLDQQSESVALAIEAIELADAHPLSLDLERDTLRSLLRCAPQSLGEISQPQLEQWRCRHPTQPEFRIRQDDPIAVLIRVVGELPVGDHTPPRIQPHAVQRPLEPDDLPGWRLLDDLAVARRRHGRTRGGKLRKPFRLLSQSPRLRLDSAVR